MTPRDLTYEALNFLGPSFNTITLAGTRKMARLAADLTQTLQKIAKALPEAYKMRRGQLIAAAETVSVTATAGSADVTFTGTFVNGSTIKVGDDPAWNEVRLVASQKTLLMPYNGTTGTVSGTLYHDAVELATDEAEILGRPLLEGYGFLAKAVNRADLIERERGESRDFGRRYRANTAHIRTTGHPTHFWVENFYGSTHATNRRFRLYPYPTAAYQLSYDARLDARVLATADLGTDAADSTFVIPMQDDMIESIVRPLFLEAWSSSPWFRDEDARKLIKDDAKDARALMETMKTQRPSNRRLRAPL